MSTPPSPTAGATTEFDLLGALFSPAGHADPQVILRGSPLPGCQYLFVREVLRDPRFAAPTIPSSPDPAFQLLRRWMIRLDGDRHRRVRDAFGGLFTARRVGRYRAIIAERAAALIDQVAPAGSMDLVAGFARPLPFAVINDVLGVPPEDREWLGEALAVLQLGFARQRDSDRAAVQAANDAAGQLLSYFARLLDQRAAEPADDLMTALAARHADAEDRQDLIANCIFFVLAGHQTTTTLLTLGTHLLCTHPDIRAALQDDPGRWPAAVEEMLRLITPTTFTGVTPRTDLAAVTAHLDVHDAIHVGHSTGGGEVTRYIARHGEDRVARAVLISAVPPLMLKTDANPGGLPKSVFDGWQDQVATNRARFYRDLPAGPFYGYNRPGAEPSEAIIDNWWRQGMMGGAKAHYDGIVAFSQTDFTDDLKQISVPVLVMHGDDDQVVPYADSGPLSAKLVQNGILKTYHGYPHGMPTTHADVINADLLAWLQQ